MPPPDEYFDIKRRPLKSITTIGGGSNDLIGTLDSGGHSYLYFKEDDGNSHIPTTSADYRTILCKIAIPEEFRHVIYQNDQIIRTVKVNSLFTKKEHELIFNIMPLTFGSKAFVDKETGRPLLEETITNLADQESVKGDFKSFYNENDEEVDPFDYYKDNPSGNLRTKACGDTPGKDCRHCPRYGTNRRTKVFSIGTRKDATYYIPTIGKTRRDGFSDIVYFAITEEQDLWDWIKKSEGDYAGIAVNGAIPEQTRLGGVDVRIVSNKLTMEPKKYCFLGLCD